MLIAAVMLAMIGWSALLIKALILLLVVCVIAWIVANWILPNVPGVPPTASRIVWAIAGIIVLIWVLANVLPAFGVG